MTKAQRNIRQAVVGAVFYSLFIAVATAAVMAATGCLSVEQRQAVLDDVAIARDVITLTFPPGPKRDAFLAQLNAATTLEQVVQIRERARAAAATQPGAN